MLSLLKKDIGFMSLSKVSERFCTALNIVKGIRAYHTPYDCRPKPQVEVKKFENFKIGKWAASQT